jgi:hypothetical protein
MTIIFILSIFLIILILFIIYKKTYTIDNFDNLESNIYTYDSCCNENEKLDCMKYGKSGVCNYFENNNSCLCQNSF